MAGTTVQDNGADRRARRTSLLISATAGQDGRTDLIPIQIRDLSVTGLSGKCSLSLRSGQRLSIRIDQGEALAGRLVWVKGDRFGLTFDHPIDPQALLRVRPPARTAPTPIGATGGFRRPALRPRSGSRPDD